MDSDAIARLVAARIPELGEADLADLSARITGDVVPMSILEKVLTALTEIEQRLAEIEARADTNWWPSIGHA
jgi:hypothetical protein